MPRSALFFIAVLAMADTPADVVDFFRMTAEALATAHSDDNQFPSDARAFLDRFDPKMPGYGKLRDEVQALVAAVQVGSAIEIVSDEGDDQKRSLELDWVLEIEGQQPRRKIVKCRIERQGKKWKIVALEPVDFFKMAANEQRE